MADSRRISSDTAFFLSLCNATLNSLANYYQAMEDRLSEMKDGDCRRIMQQLETLRLSSKDEYLAEYDVAMQQHDAVFNMLFTNFFRFSYVVLLALVLEDWMGKLCRAAFEIRNLTAKPPVPKGNTIGRYRSYLKGKAKITVSDDLWENARDLYIVRNCIVHDSGNVSRSRYRSRIEDLRLRTHGLEISNGSRDSDALLPLYLQDHMLLLQPIFCETATANVKKLFNELCARIPLNEFQFQFTDGRTEK